MARAQGHRPRTAPYRTPLCKPCRRDSSDVCGPDQACIQGAYRSREFRCLLFHNGSNDRPCPRRALVGLIPFAPGLQIANIEVGLPAFLAIITLSPTLILLAGWSANSKFPFIGGLRALFQQTAYEIPLWLSALGVIMMAGTLNLAQIVAAQSTGWFIIPQALGAFIFLVTSVAEMERLPFDLPEAESEIMMGWQAEYTGVLFLAAQGPGFVKLYAFSALFTTMFLGGFLGPSFLPPLFWMLSKTLIVIVLIMLLRSTFPRVRLDQLLRAGWTTLLTLAIVNIGITYLLVVGLPTF